MKNKLYGVLLIIVGALTVPATGDGTFLLFALLLGVALIASKEDIFAED